MRILSNPVDGKDITSKEYIQQLINSIIASTVPSTEKRLGIHYIGTNVQDALDSLLAYVHDNYSDIQGLIGWKNNEIANPYTGGTGISVAGKVIGHSNTVTGANVNSSSAVTPDFGGSFSRTYFSFDNQGHITGAGTSTVTIPSADTSISSSSNRPISNSAVYNYHTAANVRATEKTVTAAGNSVSVKSTVQTTLDGFQSHIAKLYTDLSDIGSNVSSLNTTVGNHTTTLSGHGEWLNSLNTSLASMSVHVDKIKLKTIGSSTVPVYFNNGEPTTCAYTLGSMCKESADSYLAKSGGTMTGAITANGDIKIPSAKSSYDGSVPFSGAISSNSLGAILTASRSVIGTWKDTTSGNWSSVISVRHRNGESDGVSYGMYIRSGLTSTGNLLWDKQISTNSWQGERTILDSANYTSYAAAAGHTHSYLPLSGGTMTGVITSSIASNLWINGFKGTAIINSTSGGGTYTALIKANSSNGAFTLSKYENRILLAYMNNTTINAGTNSPTYTATLLDESGNASFPETVTAKKFAGVASSAEKLSTAHTITLTGGLKGSVSFDGSVNVNLNGSLPRCLSGDDSSDFASYPYHRFAQFSMSNMHYADRSIIFYVRDTYGHFKEGILSIRVRTESDYQVGNTVFMRWLVANDSINPDEFIMTITQNASTKSVTVELWFKQVIQYDGYAFTVLHDSWRDSFTDSLVMYSGFAHGQSSYPTGTKVITSSFEKMTRAFSLKDYGGNAQIQVGWGGSSIDATSITCYPVVSFNDGAVSGNVKYKDASWDSFASKVASQLVGDVLYDSSGTNISSVEITGLFTKNKLILALIKSEKYGMKAYVVPLAFVKAKTGVTVAAAGTANSSTGNVMTFWYSNDNRLQWFDKQTSGATTFTQVRLIKLM